MAATDLIVRGPQGKRLFPSIPLGQLFFGRLQHHGDKVALVQQVDGVEVSVTYPELLRHGKIVSSLLREHGLESGDTVMLLCGNTLQFSPIMLGTLFVGAALAPVNPAFAIDDMLHMIKVIKPQVVICNEHAESCVQEALNQYNTPVVFITMEAVKKRLKEDPDVEDFYLGKVEDPDTHVAFVMCSSGTSGKPKGVETTHSITLRRMEITMLASFEEKQDRQNVFLNVSGPFWVSCPHLTMLSLTLGSKLILLAPFTVETFLDVIQTFRINNVLVAPDQLIALSQFKTANKYDLTSLQTIFYAGATVSNTILTLAQSNLGKRISNVYAMTEFMGLTPSMEANGKLGNVGKPASDVEIKIADIDTGKPVGANMKGEIRIRSQTVFSGYRSNIQETEMAFDDDGFLRTGDIGFYDEDKLFYVVDRLKDSFKYKGIHVPAIDIEDVLLQHPDVSQAAVVGMYHEVERAHATAFVVRRPDATVTEQSLRELVENQLPSYKWLHGGVHFLSALPRTATGKIRKFELRTNYGS